MSNIPPEPPDPPITSAATSQNPESSQTSRRGKGRGRGRGRGRNAGGHFEDRRVGPTANGTSTSFPRGQRDEKRWEPRAHSTNPLEGLASDGARANQRTEGLSSGARDSTPLSSRRRRNRKPNEGAGGEAQRPADLVSPAVREVDAGVIATEATRAARNQGRPRRGQFGSQLTEQRSSGPFSSARRRGSPPPNSDLTTRLTYALRTPPYPDCPICFNPLHPAQPTWSCSPSDEASSCCWASFHLKCVREWARKSTRETRDAFVARGETRDGEWRCPGCQTKRTQVPQSYLCFCGAMTDPKPGIATPHSCGMPCNRRRVSCEHPCPLSCHPGPCPPCVLTIQPPCHCAKTTLSIRCAHFHAQPPPSLSCGQTCARPLQCGTHVCERDCHPGECGICERKEIISCYCGKNVKQADCGEGMAGRQECCIMTPDGDLSIWEGRYDCGSSCERPFACGRHTCTRTCHPPSPTPGPCPFDPSTFTHCPCGKHELRQLSYRQRTVCTDPIPTCTSSCGKQLEGCSHCCAAPCHVGACPPCTIPVTVPCRCGAATRYLPCHERQRDIAQGRELVLCERVCGALRLCGRHQCSRVCCPLGLARAKGGKGKKGKVGLQQVLIELELEGAEKLWHECDLVCGKMLGCGSHKCAESDHRGPCPPCLRSSFDELICRCGRTVVFPPVPCGTRINCTYPCERPPPPCGHGKTPHTCHEDPAQCPPCPFLTSKPCACGKSNISNVRCSQEKVSCGQPCGKLLDCGFHRCQRLCHGDDCGDCSSACGKPRKLCLHVHHPCSLPCHAPSACNESEPCDSMLTVSCPCGRFQQPMKCGRCTSNPSKAIPQLQCTDSCAIAKRNARLADALGISPENKDKSNVVYPEDVLAFGKANAKFVVLVEKALNDFVASDKKTQVLPYMPEARRKFVRELCQLYRIDTQLVDQEPRRSIQLHRRIDTRLPLPSFSSQVASQNNAPNLGKLADLRASAPASRAAPAAIRSSAGASSNRGWTSVVVSTQAGSSTPSVNAWSSGASRAAGVSTTPKPPVPGSPSAVRQNWEED